MYKYLFGPVPSRRLGMSLGVDLVPHKVCTFNCIYCECGATTLQTAERKEYFNSELIKEEIDHYLSNNPAPDYITFSGAGEPSLNQSLGPIIEFVYKKYPFVPLAVITNNSLFHNEDVRKAMKKADVVLPSLDAATQDTFCKIDRPLNDFDINSYIKSLIHFRFEFSGEIWLEVMIIPGLNTDENNLIKLKEAIARIHPDRIQLNTIDRPGIDKNIRAATHDELLNIIEFWNMKNVEIIAKSSNKNKKSYRDDIENLIIETISRRPCTLQDLCEVSGLHENEINKYLRELISNNSIQTSVQERGLFYSLRNH
jgi:wyosine [tRNA(Phe)-imidazoG37] synthetase (radical SAM superfamily)